MGHGHLDPGWYDYPSLLMALLAPVQAFFGAPALGAARFVAVAIGLGGVGATWWLGRRAYGTGAAIVGAAAVAVATTHVAYSRMAVTDVLLTLASRACSRSPSRGASSGRGSRSASLRRPSTRVRSRPCRCSSRDGGDGARSAAPRVLAVAGFALTSPFVLIHAGARLGRHLPRAAARARRAGSDSRTTPITPFAYLERLWDARRAAPARRARRPRRRASAAHPHRPRPPLLRGRRTGSR